MKYKRIDCFAWSEKTSLKWLVVTPVLMESNTKEICGLVLLTNLMNWVLHELTKSGKLYITKSFYGFTLLILLFTFQAFNFMKSSTKAKFSAIRQGLSTISDFSKYDEMIQSMYGTELLDGLQNLGEGGFTYHKVCMHPINMLTPNLKFLIIDTRAPKWS